MNIKKKKLHVIGICGKGTSAVALLMRQKGWDITGSDNAMYEPIASYLKEQNLQCFFPCDPKNIPEDVDMILMGSSAALDQENNLEIQKAMSLGVPCKSFAEILEELTLDTHNIVVAGSYGKSSVSALLAYCLEANNVSPSYFIGAVPIGMESSARIGDSSYFILEGDEYPHTITSSDSKFLYYNPTTVLLTSAEHDHVNKFPTIESYTETYRRLLALVDIKEGLVVCAIHHPHVKEIVTQSKLPFISYGFKDADYTIDNIIYGSDTSFDAILRGKKIASFHTQLLGIHNIENCLGVIALCLERKLLTIQQLQSSIASFKGTTSRLDKKSELTKIPVYEGFGSSYTKAKTAIEAMLLHFPNKKVLTIFEPHTFGWRNRNNLSWYKDVFEGSEHVLVYEPPTHGAASHDQITQQEIMNVLENSRQSAQAIHIPEDAYNYLRNNLDTDTVILLLTSGDLDGMTKKIPQLCEELFPL